MTRVAIIGSGISGLTAARALHGTHDVTVFESSARIGGHTHTWDVELGGQQWCVDSGFIVYNDRNYPNFSRMLRDLDVATQPTTMSFSVRHDDAGIEYNGSDMRRLFVQPRNVARPAFLLMIRDILRFNRDAVAYMNAVPGASIGDMLADNRYGHGFRDWYLLPMASALWSIPRADVLAMPARYVISFFDNHSMLTAGSRPEWRVVSGGSARRLYHALRANSRSQSRRNIAAHYDLSNAFFAAFLDGTMTYSCALFERPGSSLESASLAKYDRIAQLLDLGPGDHLMEIGTGWGGFAIHAASNYGCRVTTTTISDAQHEVAVERVRAAGLEGRVTLLKSDYRDLRGTFDKLVSIEMIEAVDFIKRHIFPGCCIPSRHVLETNARHNGLRLVQTDEMGLHYAETLHRWRDNMLANATHIEALGFDQRFQRMWDFYFCYCEGGFLEEAIGTAQIVFAPAGASLAAPLMVRPVPPSPRPVAAA